MEPQKQARTPGDSVVWPRGPSRSQTPDDEERPEGDTAPAATSLGAEADDACADALWELPVEPAERRPECSRCR